MKCHLKVFLIFYNTNNWPRLAIYIGLTGTRCWTFLVWKTHREQNASRADRLRYASSVNLAWVLLFFSEYFWNNSCGCPCLASLFDLFAPVHHSCSTLPLTLPLCSLYISDRHTNCLVQNWTVRMFKLDPACMLETTCYFSRHTVVWIYSLTALAAKTGSCHLSVLCGNCRISFR